ncbi:MAG: nucleotide sugar dehydrogenase [Betaproteobacteria bacterium]
MPGPELRAPDLRPHLRDHSVCVLGLGYVGLTLAVAMADAGFDVLGIEIRQAVLDQLGRGEPHFHEPGLEERLRRSLRTGRLRCERAIPAGFTGTVFIVTVGTPLGTDGRARLDMVQSVSREVAARLKPGDLVIMRSTVKLGTTRKVVLPILDAAGVDYQLAFCPERTLEGRALVELRQLPQIVGGATPEATVRASQIFQFLTPTVVRVSDIETAEMIKLVDNAQRDVAFAYANEVARACDAVGVSAAEVIRAGKLGYPRTNLPMPGPVGGPCLEKDPHIFAEGLRELGLEPVITMAARRTNEGQPEEVVEHIATTLAAAGAPEAPVIALMGIAFKGQPATDDLRGTMARPVFEALKRRYPRATYRGYDAVVAQDEQRAFGLAPCATIAQALEGAHLALILNNHPVFGAMPVAELAAAMARPALIYDFWNCFTAGDLHLPAGVGYMALGSHGRALLPGRGA